MIFQYNPVDYLIEQNEEMELVITILRRRNAAPKIRYNIRDLGGSLKYRDVKRVISSHGHDVAKFPRHLAMPLLYVFGRNDLSVPFYGCKIFATDLLQILEQNPDRLAAFHSYQMKLVEGDDLDKSLHIRLERKQGKTEPVDLSGLNELFYDELKRVNQDFREVSQLFDAGRIHVEQFGFAEGPFAERDIRVKQKYIG